MQRITRSLIQLTPCTGILCLALATHAFAGGVTAPAPPLYAWLFDEGAGATTADAYGTLDGVLEAGLDAGWSPTSPFGGGSSLYFDGIDDRVLVADGRVIALKRKFTISSWFYWTDVSGFQNTIYSERQSDGFNIMWLGIEKRASEGIGLTFGIKDTDSDIPGSGVWDVVKHPVLPTPGVWHHVAAVFDETAGMSLYLNGALVASNDEDDGFRGPYAGDSTIGHCHNVAWPAYWPGKLDDVALFDDALDAGEIDWLATHSLSELEPRIYDVFCVGDGSGAGCPCLNLSAPGSEAGCAHSAGYGTRLVASGSPGIYSDTVVLTATDLPAGMPALFFQSASMLGGGVGIPFGDGRLCSGGAIHRLGIKTASSLGFASYPEPGDPPISVVGAITPLSGLTRHYQVWYRDPAPFCTAAGFNLSNAITIAWELL